MLRRLQKDLELVRDHPRKSKKNDNKFGESSTNNKFGESLSKKAWKNKYTIFTTTGAIIGTGLYLRSRRQQPFKPNIQLTKQPDEKSGDILYYIYGLGKCGMDNVDEMYNIKSLYNKSQSLFYYNFEKYSELYDEIYVKCDPLLNRIVWDVGATGLSEHMPRDNNFVNTLYKELDTLLRKSTVKNIMLLGHSYGGSVVARLALKLSNHPYVNKLQMATTGSIYIIKSSNRIFNKVENLDFVQYMFPDDLSLTYKTIQNHVFHKNQVYYFDKKNNITWLALPPGFRGTQWRIHISYGKFVDFIITNKILPFNKNLNNVTNLVI